MTPRQPWPLFLGVQQLRLVRARLVRGHHVCSAGPGMPRMSPLVARVAGDVNTRSNALYDRCATETRDREVRPMVGKHAGQRATRLLNRSKARRLLAEPLVSTQS
jgi:hypothetical protein